MNDLTLSNWFSLLQYFGVAKHHILRRDLYHVYSSLDWLLHHAQQKNR